MYQRGYYLQLVRKTTIFLNFITVPKILLNQINIFHFAAICYFWCFKSISYSNSYSISEFVTRSNPKINKVALIASFPAINKSLGRFPVFSAHSGETNQIRTMRKSLAQSFHVPADNKRQKCLLISRHSADRADVAQLMCPLGVKSWRRAWDAAGDSLFSQERKRKKGSLLFRLGRSPGKSSFN